MEKDNLPYIDCLKGIAIVFVVWGHCGSANRFYDTLYYLHLPIFSMVSGILLAHNKNWMFEKLSAKITKLVKRLMYPFFVFRALSIIQSYFYNITLNTNISIWYRVKEIFTLGYDACWFLPALCIGESIAVLIIFRENSRKKIFVSSICILLVAVILKGLLWRFYGEFYVESFLEGPIMWLLLILSRSLFFTFFVLVGYLLYNIICSVKSSRNKKVFLSMGGTTVIIVVLITMTGQFVDLRLVNWPSTIQYLLLSLSGSFAVIICFAIINKPSKLLSFLGKNSLIIMGVHFSLKKIWLSDIFLHSILPESFMSHYTIYSVLLTIVVLLFCVPYILIFNRAFPYLMDFNLLTRRIKQRKWLKKVE